MGAKAYTLIDNFIPLAGDTVVEIGSERGEGSTQYISDFCVARNLEFHSIDINPQTELAIKDNGEDWLAEYKKPIGFAYLDNFDYIFPSIEGKKWVQEQVEDYKKLGVVMNNQNSEKAHLAQAKEVSRLSRIGTEVLLDDTWLDNGWKGKGAQAVPYLLEHGFDVIETGGQEHKGFVHMRRTR